MATKTKRKKKARVAPFRQDRLVAAYDNGYRDGVELAQKDRVGYATAFVAEPSDKVPHGFFLGTVKIGSQVVGKHLTRADVLELLTVLGSWLQRGTVERIHVGVDSIETVTPTVRPVYQMERERP